MAALSAGAGLFACLGSPMLAAAAGAPAPKAAPAPKKVAILIFGGVEIIDYSGPFEAFADAGYDVFTVAATKDPITTAAGDGEKITPKYTFADAPQADVVVIPGGGYEAPSNSAAVNWIKRESGGAGHVMSVCNGAFTLANAGLLDGLSATTTAGNINRLRSGYPRVTVVNDRRVVDNGKILATAGLSAGIDGALHMIEVLDGHDRAQSVALLMEYDWRPESSFVRGTMADRMNPHPAIEAVGEVQDSSIKGGKDHWQVTRWITTKLSGSELLGAMKSAYEKAYAAEGPWAPGTFHVTSFSSPLAAHWRFDDRDGHHWQGILTVEATSNDAKQFVVSLMTNKIS
jgi:putative intracellular protease/amidase